MGGPEAGWYPDPEDRGAARYWDGTAWTDDVHTLPQAEAPSLPPWMPETPPPPPPPPTSTAGSNILAPAVMLAIAGGAVAVFLSIGSVTGPDAPPTAQLAERFDSDADRPAALEGPRLVEPEATVAAGCAEAEPGDGLDRSHFDLTDAPPAEAIYDVPLPAWGPHAPQVLPMLPGVAPRSLDVRVLLHNLEHGAIAVWVHPELMDDGLLVELTAWVVGLQEGGFRSDAGSTVFVSVAPEGAAVAPISLRAWGVALDCPDWDLGAADAFVASHFGSRGQAPEGMLGPYPDQGPLIDP